MIDPKDVVNSIFEFGGFFAILLSVRQILKDKKVAGISIPHVAFFLMWGLWNVFYYPALGQPWSGLAGILVALANGTWAVLLIHYSRKQKNENRNS